VLGDGTAESNEQAVAVCISLWETGKGVQEQGEVEQAKEHKVLPSIITKVDNEQGIVEHTVAVMGNVDFGNDRIHQGAFTKTITERMGKIRVLDTHNSGSVRDVIGKPLALWEVGKEQLPADVLAHYPDATGALMARTQFLMDTPEGKGAFVRIRDGAVGEYSIGYDPILADYTDETIGGKEQTIRNLKEIRLWEYSPVAFAMNPATSTLSAKQEQPRYVGSEDEKGASGSTSLPIADRDRAWDSTAAVAGIRRATGSEDAPSERYRQGFFWYDSGAADQFGSYKLPFAAEVDGRLTAIPRGIFATAAVLQGSRGGVDIPEDDRDAVRSRVARYYARMREQFDDSSIVPPWEKAEEPELEAKVGRTFSAANIRRIQGAIDGVQQALSDLEQMLSGAMPDEPETEEEQSKEAPPQEEAALDSQQEQDDEPEAGPPDQAPTEKGITLADVEQWIIEIQSQLSEETK